MARRRRAGLIVLVFECSALVSRAMPRKLFAVRSPGAGRALGGVIFMTLAVLVAASSAPAAGPTSDREAAAPEIGDGRGGVKLVKLGDFDNPTYVDSAPGFKRLLFVVEQTGTIKVLR